MVPVAFNEFQFSIDKKTHTKLYWGSNPSHKSLCVCARGPTTLRCLITTTPDDDEGVEERGHRN